MSVDWGLAGRIGRLLAGDEPAQPPPAALAVVGTEAEARVVAATGLVPSAPLPPPEWIGRDVWIDANLATMRSTVGDALERGVSGAPGPLRGVAGALAAAELGALLGFIGRRVLGQYELRLLDPEAPARLLLVAPNLDRAAVDLGVDREELVTWVGLHEVTHAVQFGGVPWLRGHLAGLLGELLAALEVRIDARQLLSTDVDDLRALAGAVREGGLVGVMLGPERRAALDAVQATMALVEGHAEWTMDRTGRDAVRDLPRLRSALNRRREERAPLLRLLDRLLGFDLKLRQYDVGRRFCDAVVAARGDEALQLAWAAPEMLPTLAELADPPAWLRRAAAAA